MTISLYEGRQITTSHLVRAMTIANLAFALLVLAGWPLVGPWLADPISQATGVSLPESERPDYVTYPYWLLWLTPLLAVVGASFASSMANLAMARIASALPLTVIAACLVWFYWLSADFS